MLGQNKVCFSRTSVMLSATREADKGRDRSEHPLVATETHISGTDLERSIWHPDGKLDVLTGNIKDLQQLYLIRSRGTTEFVRVKEVKKTGAYRKLKSPFHQGEFLHPAGKPSLTD